MGLQSGKNRGVLSIPGPDGMFRDSHGPRGSRWPARGRGGRGRDPRESGDPVRSALRFRPGTASSAPGMCACAGAAAERGGGGQDPLPAPPQRRPRPHAPYSAWLPRSARCAALPAPASAPARVPALAPLPLAFQFPLGCRCALARARASRGARFSATACSACRGGAGWGGARPSRPGARDPRPRRRRRQQFPGAGPALPQPRPALLRPRAAAHATAARSRRPAPRLRSLSSAGPPPGSFPSWGEAEEGEGRAAPLCALPARHPHSGRRGARPGGREKLEASAPARRVRTDGQACVECDIQTGGSRGADIQTCKRE